jgi:hypothetical protein
MAATSIAPSAAQQMALPRSSAIQYPVAALKQRTALVHPLAHAAGLLSIFRNFIWRFPLDRFYLNKILFKHKSTGCFVVLRTYQLVVKLRRTKPAAPCARTSVVPLGLESVGGFPSAEALG